MDKLLTAVLVLLLLASPAWATTISESFNTADSSTLGPDLTWTETAGDLQIVSNHVEGVTNSVLDSARAETDLATSNQFVQAAVTFSGGAPSTAVAEVAARYDPAANNYYCTIVYTGDGGTSYKLGIRKVVAGADTTLGTDVDVTALITPGSPNTIRLEVEGTSPNITLRMYIDATLKQTVTGETTYDGQRRTGIALFWNDTATTSVVQLDAFSAGDLAGGGYILTEVTDCINAENSDRLITEDATAGVGPCAAAGVAAPPMRTLMGVGQ